MAKEIYREIPSKNYVIATLCIAISFVMIVYISKWYIVYQEDNLNTAIISTYLNEISYDEFKNYVSENPNAIVYIGIANDQDSRSYENTFKNIVDNYHLKDTVIYLNITSFTIEVDYINKYNALYGTDKKKISQVPAIVIFENGKLSAVLDKKMTKNNTVSFLKKYDVIN